ncbi:MAG: glycosyltransferase family 4 protein [Prevotella sp.]|nr:glycosyltransferase family 4 protein [Prevotella sp.]
MKILIVSTMPSHPTDAGNRAAIMGQVGLLQNLGHDVHYLFASMELSNSIDYDAMKCYWGEKLHIFTMNKLLKARRFVTDLWRKKVNGYYWKVDDHYPWGIASYINKLNEKEKFGACIIQYYRLSRLLPSISIPRKAIYTHDVFAYKDIRTGKPFYEACTAHEEAKAMQRCPNIFAIQQEEAVYYKMLSPKSNVYTVYSSFKTCNQKIQNNKVLLFLASRMAFNTNGIQWFLDNVWQPLKAKAPEIRLMIGGTVCENIKQAYKDVTLCGKVDRLDDFYALGDIVINPVYQGTGLKIKTFEALSYGKATIVHPHSMTGIYNASAAPLTSASSSDEWTEAILNLVNNPQLIEKRCHQSVAYIEEMNDFICMQYKKFLV